MDPHLSHFVGDEEEDCNSSESGWTMYLAPHIMHDNDNDEGVDDGSNSNVGDEGDGEDDDDSMVSDASSGPVNRGHYSSERSDAASLIGDHHDANLDDDGDKGGSCSYENMIYKAENKKDGKKKKSVSQRKDVATATSLIQRGSKVRKAN